jgi:hypothetical protein
MHENVLYLYYFKLGVIFNFLEAFLIPKFSFEIMCCHTLNSGITQSITFSLKFPYRKRVLHIVLKVNDIVLVVKTFIKARNVKTRY